MSTWLSTGAGSAYGLDLELIKSPPSSSSTRTSHTSSSSPSSTISESSNSPLAISTRKPRTPRKRPNQTYNEAAALLSTVYPKIFSIKHLTKPYKSSNSSNFMLPFTDFESPDFLLYPPVQEKPSFFTKPKLVNSFEKSCQSPGEVESKSVDLFNEVQEDFDAESILDEEIQEEGVIDSIMGNLDVDGNLLENEKNWNSDMNSISCGGEMNPLGLGFGTMMRGVRAFRRVDDGNWWCFPVVDVQEISPRLHTNNNNSNNNKVVEKKKKKMSELMSKNSEIPAKETSNSNSKNSSASEKGKSGGLLLKLNYDEVLNAWSDKASPFPEDMSGSDSTGNNDVQARLAQINLFSENGGLREASVMRYKEKRRTRLFSKKIRYQVRKVNADQRPRMKGRFVRRPSSKEGVKGKKGSDKR